MMTLWEFVHSVNMLIRVVKREQNMSRLIIESATNKSKLERQHILEVFVPSNFVVPYKCLNNTIDLS